MGKFERMSLTGNCHPIVTRDSRASRAPPHHILPAFLNIHGTKPSYSNKFRKDDMAKIHENTTTEAKVIFLIIQFFIP